MKEQAIIIDIDGTLSNCEHRRYFLDGDKPDWRSFSESCVMDSINEWCRQLIFAMDPNFCILFVSGREDEYRNVTVDFISNQLGWCGEEERLYMRKNGDYRPDTIIKEEIYNEHIKDKYDVLFCVDDRPSVCRMWRSLGLTVLQCADKEF